MSYVSRQCLLCASSALEDVVRLTPTPPANALAESRKQALDAVAFPLDLARCAACGLVQLTDALPRDELFRDYKYATGAAPGLVSHFRALADDVLSRVDLPPGSVVVELGSNDGTLLKAFAERGMRVLGVDPAVDIGQQARESGVPTLTEHFNAEVADRIVTEFGGADVVLANNVLAHVEDLNGVLAGVRSLLGPTSSAVVEVAHLLPMALSGAFEFVYHEHMSYFSLATLCRAMMRHDLRIVDVAEVATQGGSLRCWVRRVDASDGANPSSRVAALIDREQRAGLTDGLLLRDFDERVRRVTGQVADVLGGLAGQGRRIAGYGASARAVTFMAQCDIAQQITWIADDNPRKVGWYVPGSGVEVVEPDRLTAGEIDYCVLFAWNFADHIIQATRTFWAGGGSYIVPFPTLNVR
ncbi:class I SAM-dependent methyltransferase [Micromonospora sp. NPDC005652]|uniref:class I SAM-dependent methyltransferase n=1 Tax=Micromonospora sp. NPDC005652 TaxID=3157046 RepID=UPI0033CF9E5D